MVNARVARDIKTRNTVMVNEILRRAYLFVARNQTLSTQIRHHAQMQLNTFDRYTRPTAVKNRCHESGRGRGVMSEFALSRVCGGIFHFVLHIHNCPFVVSVPVKSSQG